MRRRYSWMEIGDDSDFDYERSIENEPALNLLRGLNEFRKEGTLCDLTLRVGERTIRLHRNVILSSPYIMAMLSGNLSQSNQQEIVINEVDADSLEILIDYVYTAKLNIDSGNVKKLLSTASFLQITKAEQLCYKSIWSDLNKENCIEYLLFAGKNSIKRLVYPSIRVASENFSCISSKNEYLELEFEEFKQLTQRLKTDKHVEDHIYSFVMRWINYSHETRISFTGDLLDILDPLLISPNVLHSSDIVNTSNPIFTAWAARNVATNEPKGRVLTSRILGIFRPLNIKSFSQKKRHRLRQFFTRIRQATRLCR